MLLVLPGDCRADVGIYVVLESEKSSHGIQETVEARTGVLGGGVPPFGSAMGLQTYGSEVGRDERISFNAGLRERSISMLYKDYVEVEKPIVVG